MSATDPAVLSATELMLHYRRRTLSPVEVARACLERIARWNDTVDAFCLVDEDGALAAARASESAVAEGRAARAGRRRAGHDQGPGAHPRLDRSSRQPHHRRAIRPRRPTPRPRPGCARPGPCCWAARPRPSSAGRRSPTTPSAMSLATLGTSALRPAARAAGRPSPRRWAWAPCISVPTAAAPSASRRAFAGSWGSSRPSAASPPGPCRRSAPSPISGR